MEQFALSQVVELLAERGQCPGAEVTGDADIGARSGAAERAVGVDPQDATRSPHERPERGRFPLVEFDRPPTGPGLAAAFVEDEPAEAQGLGRAGARHPPSPMEPEDGDRAGRTQKGTDEGDHGERAHGRIHPALRCGRRGRTVGRRRRRRGSAADVCVRRRADRRRDRRCARALGVGTFGEPDVDRGAVGLGHRLEGEHDRWR